MKKKIIISISLLSCLLLLTVSAPLKAQNTTSLSLEPASGDYEIGDVFEVKIILNTDGQDTDGVDIRYLNYPASLLEVVDADQSLTGTQIKADVLYPNTLTNNVLAEQGKIEFSQLTFGGEHFSGSGVLATVKFKAIAAGKASLTFDFEDGSTIDCNVAVLGKDVLSSVKGASFVLGGDATEPAQPIEPTEPAEPSEPINAQGNGQAISANSKIVLFITVAVLLLLIVVFALLVRRKK